MAISVTKNEKELGDCIWEIIAIRAHHEGDDDTYVVAAREELERLLREYRNMQHGLEPWFEGL